MTQGPHLVARALRHVRGCQGAVGSRTGSGAVATEAGTGALTRACTGTGTGSGRLAGRLAPERVTERVVGRITERARVVERATGARDAFGTGTVMATRTPSATAATTTTAMPGPELVCDSSSMANVEKMTVQEPYVSCATVGRGMAIGVLGSGGGLDSIRLHARAERTVSVT